MIPKVYKRIPPENFSINGVPVLKTHIDVGLDVMKGLYEKNLTPVGSPLADNDPINDNGTYHSVFWHSLNHQYYQDKFLSYSPSEITIPYFKSGESLRPGSIQIFNNNFNYSILDDSQGNLYRTDRSDLTRDFNKRCKTVLEWDFSTLYPTTGGYTGTFEGKYPLNQLVKYKNANNHESTAKYSEIKIFNSQKFNNKMNGISIHKDSYIHCKHQPEFNLIEGSFLIKFKLRIEDAIVDTDLINVNKVRNKTSKGQKIVQSDLNLVNKYTTYEEVEHVKSYAWPFHFEIKDNKLVFSRSDGKLVSKIEYDLSLNEYDIQIYRYPSGSVFKIALFIDGALFQNITDNTKYTANDYDLIIGNFNNETASTDEFNITLSSIEIFNKLNANTIQDISELANDLAADNYNGIIGNVYYQNGQIILNSRFHNDFDYFDNATTHYTSVHTIYEYEALIKVGKGEFNLSMNPSARVAYESDILIEEFQNGLLSPYITTIGLYDPEGNLLVVGKLAQAIETRSDVDLNFIISWSV